MIAIARIPSFLRASLAAGLIAAAASPLAATSQTTQISGTITYRERIALSPDAVVEVRLDDVTRAGAVPPVIARAKVTKAGQVPIKFQLEYDARAIDPRGRYAVRATISDGGVDLFTSLDTVLVLTQGRSAHADLVLTRVGTPKPVAAPAAALPLPPPPFANLPATFTCADCDGSRIQLNLFADDSFFMTTASIARDATGTDDLGSWALSSDRRVIVLRGAKDELMLFQVVSSGTLRRLDANGLLPSGKTMELTRAAAFRPLDVKRTVRGSYSLTAGQAAFVECSTGQRWTIAAGGARQDLERAYAASKVMAGSAVLVEVDGAISERPRSETDPGGRTIVIAKVGRVLPKEQCAPRFAAAPLADTYWRLTQLGRRMFLPAADPRREPSITFQAADGQMSGSFSGSSGCNRLIGKYEITNAAITLTPGGTMMACKDVSSAEAEASLVNALKATRSYRIAGRTLELMDEKGMRIAKFEARPAAGITVR